MILVVGETLVDLVVEDDGRVEAALGGAPSNTAVAAARLGCPVGFAGAISTDRFGQRLHDRLVLDGVDVSRVVRVEAPTSLAMAEIDGTGAADYRFYFSGTSVPELRELDTSDADALMTGGLALVLEPMATVVEQAVVEADVPVVIDVNCRPAVIEDLAAYRRRVDRLIPSTSIGKVSDDDLEVLRPGRDPIVTANELVELGAGAIVLTRGVRDTTIVTRAWRVDVPVPPLPPGRTVVDTIGAGDTFDAGLLTSLHEAGHLSGASGDLPLDRDTLVAAIRRGQAAAAVTVTRRGADPPRREELRSDPP